jgi:pyruvate formate lyase activating enzyme
MLVRPFREKDRLNIDTELKEKNEESLSLIEEETLFDFLETRVNKLDGVVVTGGEPTLQKDLPKFLRKVKKMGFKVKLDTNGTNPKMLKKLIKENLVDYLAMDVKAGLDTYEKVVGLKIDLEKIKESIKIIIGSNISYEFRTTLVPGLVGAEEVKDIGEMIKEAEKWFLQNFKSDIRLVNKELVGGRSYTEEEMGGMIKIANKFIKECKVR